MRQSICFIGMMVMLGAGVLGFSEEERQYQEASGLGRRGIASMVIGMEVKDFLQKIACKEVETATDEEMEAIYQDLNAVQGGDAQISKKDFIKGYRKSKKSIRNFYIAKHILPQGVSLIQCTFKEGKLYYIYVVGKSEEVWSQWASLLSSYFGEGKRMVSGQAMSFSWQEDDVGIILGRKERLYMVSYTDLLVLHKNT